MGQEGQLGRVAGEFDGPVIGGPSLIETIQAAQQVSASGVESVITLQRFAELVDLGQTHGGAVQFSERDRPVQPHDRRRVEPAQKVVQRHDLTPVRVPGIGRVGVHGVDRRQHLVPPGSIAAGGHDGQPLAHQGVPLRDELPVPDRAVLIRQRHQRVGARHPGRASGVRQQHQRQQPRDLPVVGQQRPQHAAQPDRLVGQIDPYRGRARSGQVALVEDQIDDRQDSGQAPGQIVGGRHPVGHVVRSDLGLGAGQPPGHRGLGHQEGLGDLGHRQPTQQAQRQRDPCLDRERRVAAQEDQPQPVVGHRAGGFGWCVVVEHLGRLLSGVALGLAATPVDRLAGGRRGEPATGVGRQTVLAPVLHGREEGFGRCVLGNVEVTEAAHQGGDQPTPLLPVQVRDRVLHRRVRGRGHRAAVMSRATA